MTAMGFLDRYLVFADRSRRKGFALSVVSSPDEAKRLVAEIASSLSKLSDEEKTLFLSNLGELKDALHQRCEVLKSEIDQNREELARITRTLFACNAYALAATSARRSSVKPAPSASRDSSCR